MMPERRESNLGFARDVRVRRTRHNERPPWPRVRPRVPRTDTRPAGDCMTGHFSMRLDLRQHFFPICDLTNSRELRVGSFAFLATLFLFSCATPPVRAQPSVAAQNVSEVREKAYDDLAQEVQALERQGMLLRKVVALVKPAVVHIESEHGEEPPRPGRKPAEETGSGVVIEISGKLYVLTNRHVIKHSPVSKIKIKLADGRHVTPTKQWSDPGTDVAVLAMSVKDLTPARLGDSTKLDIGDFVLAIGSPFGLSHSVTFGIISAKSRRDLQLGTDGVVLQDFLQTDAAINPGNSGGPLVNLRGEVVGINTAIASASGSNDGVGFSIPINMALHIAKQLIERNRVVRAYLGVHFDDTFNDESAIRLGLPRREGARVRYVTANSPAATSKLQVNDVILEYEGVRIEDDNHLITLVGLTPVGKEVSLLVYRNNETRTIQVKVDDRKKFENPEP